MPTGMQRHRENKTTYEKSTKTIHWQILWKFDLEHYGCLEFRADPINENQTLLAALKDSENQV